MKLPKLKQQPKTRSRKRLPQLTPDRLKLFELELRKRFPDQTTEAILKTLQAKPDDESVPNTLKQLPPARGKTIHQTRLKLDGLFTGISSRGSDSLSQLTPEQWAALQETGLDVTSD